MNILSKTLLVSGMTSLFSQAVSALPDTHKHSDYSVIALKNCHVVSSQKMSKEQFEAYTSLKQQEQKMHKLEEPIQAIELEIDSYSNEIEKLTELAIQETDKTLHIDKTILKQQEAVAAEFSQFMQQHQSAFDTLGEQGKIIGEKANTFQVAIKTSLSGVEYDQIQILTPDSDQSQPSCDSTVRITVI